MNDLFFGNENYQNEQTNNGNYEQLEEEVLTVIEADFTQKKAIKESLQQSIYLQGPPGTGKTQTIINMIANNLYQSKTVLFSTEKVVAREVIIKKLPDLLQNFILSINGINSSKDKKNTYDQVIERLKLIDEQENNLLLQEKYNKVCENIKFLNEKIKNHFHE
jgi:DNA replication protein DnaC